MKILFVCTGNTCRSPMAEGFMNKLAKENGLEAEAASAGIFAESGAAATEEAVEAAARFGVDISSHKASLLNDDLIKYSDLILTMTESHKQLLFPLASEKIFTLNEYAGIGGNIPDPFGGDIDEYVETAEHIMDAVEKTVKKLKNQ